MIDIKPEKQAKINEVLKSTRTQLSEIMGQPVTVLYRIKVNDISMEHIVQTVCRVCNTTWSQMMQKNRKSEVVVPRQLTTWLLRKYCGMELHHIARELGHADHTTPFHSIQRVDEMIETGDVLYTGPLDKIEASILNLISEQQ